jgi:6-phosphofructokinase 2
MIKPGELAKLVGVEHLRWRLIGLQRNISKGGARSCITGTQGAVLSQKIPMTMFLNVAKKNCWCWSMVGGMVWALAQNKPLKEVLRWGVACGSAATMNEGTQLFIRRC